MLQRWKMSHNNSMVTEPDGEWVEYKDHIAAIAEKDREIERLNEQLAEKDNEISDLKRGIERLKAELKVAYAIKKQNITVV